MFGVISQPNIDGIWVILKAESCWADLILYLIGNRTRYTIQIKIENGSCLLVRGDTPGDTSQPWIQYVPDIRSTDYKVISVIM